MPSRNIRTNTNVSPAFKVYLEAQTESQKKHGDKTIVMMQMGSFLEMFHVKFSDGTELGKADDLDDLLSKMGKRRIRLERYTITKKYQVYHVMDFHF